MFFPSAINVTVNQVCQQKCKKRNHSAWLNSNNKIVTKIQNNHTNEMSSEMYSAQFKWHDRKILMIKYNMLCSVCYCSMCKCCVYTCLLFLRGKKEHVRPENLDFLFVLQIFASWIAINCDVDQFFSWTHHDHINSMYCSVVVLFFLSIK